MAPNPSRYLRLNDHWERIDFATDSIKGGPPRILTLVQLSEVTHEAVSDGEWADPDTWLEGNIPGDGREYGFNRALRLHWPVRRRND